MDLTDCGKKFLAIADLFERQLSNIRVRSIQKFHVVSSLILRRLGLFSMVVATFSG